MLINDAEKRDNCFATRTFRALETNFDGGDNKARSRYAQTPPKNISIDPSMVVSMNQNKKLFRVCT